MERDKIDHTDLSIFFTKWEKDYPVETWEIGGVHVWPILKKIIFFKIIRENKGQIKKTDPLIIRALKKAKKIVNSRLYIKRLKLEKANFLFSSGYNQRIAFKDKEFNRFIEPLMDYLEKQGERSYLLEYPQVKKNNANYPERIVDIQKMLPYYASSKNKKNILRS